MRTTLAIVTVCFNNAEGLQRTLESIQKQDASPDSFEHIVIDGGSTDSTADVVRAFSIPAARFVSEPDRGVYHAMNKGLEATSAPFVQFLNAGDTFADGASLSTVISELEAVRPLWLVAEANNLHGGLRDATSIGNVPHVWWRHALGLQPHCHQASFFARPLLEVLGGHSEDFGFVGDFDLILRAGLIEKPHVLPRTVIDYEGGGMSAQAAMQIPRSIAAVRRERLNISGAVLRLDQAFVALRSARACLHRFRREHLPK